jgi:hypothetical protein
LSARRPLAKGALVLTIAALVEGCGASSELGVAAADSGTNATTPGATTLEDAGALVSTLSTGACTTATRTGQYATSVSARSTSSDSRATLLSQTASLVGQADSAVSDLIITLGGEMELNVSSSMAEGNMIEFVQFGDAFRGIKSATFSSTGTTLQGGIDGVPLPPFPVEASGSTIRPVDEATLPSVTLEPVAQAAMMAVIGQATVQVSSCGATPSLQPRLANPRTTTEESCAGCQSDCATSLAKCSTAAANLVVAQCEDAFACAAAIVAAGGAMAACQAASLACAGVCERTSCCVAHCAVAR